MKIHDIEADLDVDRGVFSARRIDPGTALLLEAGVSSPSERGLQGHLLDLGCGYGPIALAVAVRNPQATVWALDINRRALDLVAANATKLGLSNLRPVTADQLPGDIRFTRIWSNPPIRIGKTALQNLLLTWLGRLAPGGAARLVVARNLGADSLSVWLESVGMAVTRCASKRGYRILEVEIRPEANRRQP